MASSVSKLRENIKQLSGVDIMEADNMTFKSTYDILDELSKVWGTIQDVDKANILEQIAGKRQANIVSGLLTNFGKAREVLQISLNSSGSAMKEYETYLDSVGGRLSKLTATFESFSLHFLDTDFVKGAISALTGLLDILDRITESVGGLGTTALAGGIVGALYSFKKRGIGSTFKGLNDFIFGTGKDDKGNPKNSIPVMLGNIPKTFDKIKKKLNGESIGEAAGKAASETVESATEGAAKAAEDVVNNAVSGAESAGVAAGAEIGAKAGTAIAEGAETAAPAIVAEAGAIGAEAGTVAGESATAAAATTGISGAAAAGILAGVAVAAIAAGYGLGKLREEWQDYGDDVKESNEELRSHVTEYRGLADYQKQISDAQAIINNPNSSESDVAKAKQTLEEIGDQLEKDYDLKINVTGDNIDDVVSSLKEVSFYESLISAKEGAEDISGTKMWGLGDKGQYQSGIEELLENGTEYQQAEALYNKAQYAGEGLAKAVDYYNESTKNKHDDSVLIKQAKKDYEEIMSIANGLESAGVQFEGFGKQAYESLKKIDPKNMSVDDAMNLYKVYNQIATDAEAFENNINVKGYKERLEQLRIFSAQTKEGINERRELLKAAKDTGDADNIELAKEAFIDYGKALKDVGASSTYAATQFALTETGFNSFDKALKKEGGVDKVYESFVDFSKSIGATKEEIITGGALIKSGIGEPANVTNKNMQDLFKTMKSLGKQDWGAETLFKSAEYTALFASGYNDVTEALLAGEKGITSYAANLKTVLSQNIEGFANLDVSKQSEAITKMAQDIGLIPENKEIRIDVKTGKISVVEDVTKQLNDYYQGGDKSFKVRVDPDINANNREQFDFSDIENKNFTLHFTPDGTEVISAELDGIEHKVKAIDGSKITFQVDDKDITIDANTGEVVEVKAAAKVEEVDDSEITGKELVIAGKAILLGEMINDGEIEAHGVAELIGRVSNEGELTTEGTVYLRQALSSDSGFTTEQKIELIGELKELGIPDEQIIPVIGQLVNKGDLTEGEAAEIKAGMTITSTVTNPPPTEYSANQDVSANLTEEPPSEYDATQNVAAKITKEPKSEYTGHMNVNTSVNTDGMQTTFYGTMFVNTVQAGVSALMSRLGVGGSADGTAWSDGSAYARGKWGVKRDERALVGELGRELVVRNGQYFTVGDNGAEFVNIKKDDIIFSAEQTRQLLEQGKIIRGRKRGKVNGLKSAFAEGSTGNAYASGSDKDSKQTVDFVSDYLDSIDRRISNIEKTAKSTYKNLNTRVNSSYNSISEMKSSIQAQYDANAKYWEKAVHLGLSSSIMEKAKYGSLNITDYDSATASKISDFQGYFQKMKDTADKIIELKEDIAAAYEDIFDATEKDYENQLALYEHVVNSYENEMDFIEESGYLATTKYYELMRDSEEKSIDLLNKEYNALTAALQTALDSGYIQKSSEAYYDMTASINDVAEALQEAQIEVQKLNKDIQETEWERFEYVQDLIGNITDEADFLIKLMAHSELFNEDGSVNDLGQATLGLHAQNYNVYMAQADKYAKEVEEIDKRLAKDPYNYELLDHREELLKSQREAILAAEDEKDALRDLAKNGVEKEKESLKDLIDKYKSTIDSAKDLYDYQKRVREQTKEIANLRKQVWAYGGDTSEESKAIMQKLQVDLGEAIDELEETEYDRYISEQSKLLDTLYDEYELSFNERMDDIDFALQDILASVNMGAGDISATLTTQADNVGYTLSENMRSIWQEGGGGHDVVTAYGTEFLSRFTTINDTLNGIGVKVQAMVDYSTNKVKTTTPAKKTTSSSSSSTSKSATSTSSTAAKKTTAAAKPARTTADYYGVALAICNGTLGWGTGQDRINKLTAKGFDANKVQTIVNQMFNEGLIHSNAWKGHYAGISDLSPYAYNRYKKGGLVDYTGLAQVDGSPSEPEMVLNPIDTENFIKLRNVMRDISTGNSPLSALFGNASGGRTVIDDLTDAISSPNIKGTSYGDFNYTVTIPIDHVENYNDFVSKLQKDGQFENMIKSMTIDRVAGGSKLSKNKYKWH